MGNSLCIRFSSNVVFSSYFSEKKIAFRACTMHLMEKIKTRLRPFGTARLPSLKFCGVPLTLHHQNFEGRGYNVDYIQSSCQFITRGLPPIILDWQKNYL